MTNFQEDYSTPASFLEIMAAFIWKHTVPISSLGNTLVKLFLNREREIQIMPFYPFLPDFQE